VSRNKEKHDPFAVLRYREYNLFLSFRFFLTLGIQMQSVIVGWQIYELTDDVLYLGLIGLAEAIPFIIVSLFSGHVADTYKRKHLVVFFTSLFLLLTGFLYWLSLHVNLVIIEEHGSWPIFAAICGVGIIRGFLSAAIPAFMAQIIPRELYANAATWNSTVWHVASIIGPSLAGFMIAAGYTAAYTMDISFIAIALVAFALIAGKPKPVREKSETLYESLSAGVKFVFKNQLILAALTLDLFAVLFGGAVALLPAFSEKVLHTGAIELGFLRAAPAIGAVIMALIIAYRPPTHNAGRNLLLSVALFGVSTVLFGLSTNFYLAFFFLLLTGAFDNVSVVIRHTILQLSTPDNMRGRVSAVNGIFIGSSNEIGAFESGVTARMFGIRPAIVLGGVLTMAVVMGTAQLAPKLRKLNIDQLH
jgi:MFS family permease